MKKQLILTTLLLAGASAAQAQSNVIKLNTLSLAVKTLSVFWEHQTAIDRSLNLGIFVANYSSQHTGPLQSRTSFRGLGLTTEYRLHPGTEALRGFFYGPYLRFQHYNYSETSTFSTNAPVEDKATLTTFGGGGVLGWQGIIANHLSIEPFVGAGYAAGEVDNLDDKHGTLIIENGIRGLELRLGLNVGYAFGKAKE